jgi:type I restriction enzyme M protein
VNSQALGQKVYNFCHTLRDDGVSYGDYLEQLTYLIFLKMAHEFSQPPFDRDLGVPQEYQWPTLAIKRGVELEAHYVALLRELGNAPGMLGQIYIKSQNRINDPAKLHRLVQMPTSLVMFMKTCLSVMRLTPKRALGNISHHVR